MDVQRSTTTLRQRTRFTSHAPEAHATLPVVGDVSNIAIAGGAAALLLLVTVASKGDGPPNVTIT